MSTKACRSCSNIVPYFSTLTDYVFFLTFSLCPLAPPVENVEEDVFDPDIF